jgi:cyclophilin family peptidyl-prolyl cis-trans isomerase
VATDKRERQRAAREAKLEAETTDERRSRRTRTGIRVAAIVAVALAAAFAYSVIFGGDDGDDGDGDDDDVVTDEPADEENEDESPDDATDEGEAGSPGEAFEGREADEGCPASDGSAESQTEFDEPPPWCIDVSATYVAELATTDGAFEITLDPMAAPVAVNNFVFLARSHYYDDSMFHRVIADFVVQGGDPVGDPPGTGTPGYTLGDSPDFSGELPTDDPAYPLMSVAMANSGSDPASAGSQFFVVTGAQGETLPTDYTRFGQVSAGEDVVRAIEAQSTDETDMPTGEPIAIESVTVTETAAE